MKKGLFLGLSLICFCTVLLVGCAHTNIISYNKEDDINFQNYKSILIIPIENDLGISDILTKALMRTNLKIIDRAEYIQIVNEQKLDLKGKVQLSDDQLDTVEKLTNVDLILTYKGFWKPENPNLAAIVSIKIINAKAGNKVFYMAVQTSDEIFAAEGLVERITRDAGKILVNVIMGNQQYPEIKNRYIE